MTTPEEKTEIGKSVYECGSIVATQKFFHHEMPASERHSREDGLKSSR
jgi:hypothetical protein